jgi:hypothetical protein
VQRCRQRRQAFHSTWRQSRRVQVVLQARGLERRQWLTVHVDEGGARAR